MRCFGIEGCDLFGFVENLHRAVQHHMHIDSPVSVRAKAQDLGDLQDRPLKSNRVILGYRGLLFETQSPFDLQRSRFWPSGSVLTGMANLRLCTAR